MSEENNHRKIPIEEFEQFSRRIDRFISSKEQAKNRIPVISTAYDRHPSRMSSVSKGYDVDTIREMLAQGSPEDLRELSRHFVRYSGIYSRLLHYFSTLLQYRGIIIPHFNDSTFEKLSESAKKKMYDQYIKTCDFIDILNIPLNFTRITHAILINGIYFGILREDGDAITIQDLPIQFCRVLFKNLSNLEILEFDVQYFDRKIKDEETREKVLATFPDEVITGYKNYKSKKGNNNNSWVEIPPEIGGCVFYYQDFIPLLISSLPQILAYDDAQDREAQRDINSLNKLLIQEFPTDKEGELVFDLSEIYEMHEAVSNMLRGNNGIDVISSVGKLHLENGQDSGSATDAKTKLMKYRDAAYDVAGTAQLLFNPNSSASLSYSIDKDIELMYSWSKIYSTWLTYQINLRYGNPNISFEYEILPISIHNSQKMVDNYKSLAQYGYPKLYAAAAAGISQSNFIGLNSFENHILKLNERMIPLMSSYTTPGSDIKTTISGENISKSITPKDITDSGGRPQLTPEERSAKTTQNQESG